MEAVKEALQEFRAVSLLVQVKIISLRILVLEKLETQSIRLNDGYLVRSLGIDVLRTLVVETVGLRKDVLKYR